MKYEVIVMPRAEQEMEDAFEWLSTKTDQHAPTWYNGLVDAILSLDEMAGRCPIVPEAARGAEELRQLLYGDRWHSYRVIFAIRGTKVVVLHVRHAAQDRLP
jgi:plasmid stabilization system protein ParE